MEAEWEEVRLITNGEVVDAPNELVVLEWKLNRTPEREWVKYFISGPGHKSGTADFLSRAPDVIGNKVRFMVLEQDMGNAVRRVEGAVASANQTFETYVMSRRREETARQQAEENAKQQWIQAANERLRRMNP